MLLLPIQDSTLFPISVHLITGISAPKRISGLFYNGRSSFFRFLHTASTASFEETLWPRENSVELTGPTERLVSCTKLSRGHNSSFNPFFILFISFLGGNEIIFCLELPARLISHFFIYPTTCSRKEDNNALPIVGTFFTYLTRDGQDTFPGVRLGKGYLKGVEVRAPLSKRISE